MESKQTHGKHHSLCKDANFGRLWRTKHLRITRNKARGLDAGKTIQLARSRHIEKLSVRGYHWQADRASQGEAEHCLSATHPLGSLDLCGTETWRRTRKWTANNARKTSYALEGHEFGRSGELNIQPHAAILLFQRTCIRPWWIFPLGLPGSHATGNPHSIYLKGKARQTPHWFGQPVNRWSPKKVFLWFGCSWLGHGNECKYSEVRLCRIKEMENKK